MLEVKKIDGGYLSIDLNQSIVFLGANGSGKTNLAKDIYYNQLKNKSYLIGAHKDLSLPKTITIESLDSAKNKLYFGHATNDVLGRWSYNNLPYEARDYGIIVDFSNTISYVFAKQNKQTAKYVNEMRDNPTNLRVPENFIVEKIQNIWNLLIPHKKIKLTEGTIIVEDIDTKEEYFGTTLSDGEKHLLYLISQVLCCDYSTIIIDEPEHYLNKAILSKLWDLLEQERKDITFIYITHDIDFAISRENSKKIWIKKYIKSKNCWDLEEIISDDNLSDKLILSILGNKKKILFTEGEKDGYEEKLFNLLFEDYKVVPLKTCHDVIRMITSVENKKYPFFKEYSFVGIIDRDYLGETYLESLKNKKIKILDVAEIENLFITPEVIDILCKIYNEDPDTLVKLEDRLFEEATKILNEQVINCLKYRLKTSIQNINIDKKAKDEKCILEDLSGKTKGILDNITTDYEKIKKNYSSIIESKDYRELLKLFNYKGFLNLADNILGMKVTDKILNTMLRDKVNREKFSKEFLKYIPINLE